jgi:hypothetical protein
MRTRIDTSAWNTGSLPYPATDPGVSRYIWTPGSSSILARTLSPRPASPEMSTALESVFAYNFNYLEEKERQIKERQKYLPF